MPRFGGSGLSAARRSADEMTALDRLRAPAYTGRNRCYPCTAINVVLVAVVAGLTGAVAPLVGVVVASVGLAAVWLRGYVVPGTPRLTRQYLPDRLLARFGKSVERSAFTLESEPAPRTDDPTEALAALGVLTDATEPALTASFADAWSEAASRLARDTTALRTGAARAVSGDPAGVGIETPADGGVRLVVDEQWIGNWPSRTALVCDLATELTLSGQAWADLERATRADLLARIRGFTSECPVCGSDTALSDDTVESCCRSVEVIAVQCPGRDERLVEFERSAAAFAPGV